LRIEGAIYLPEATSAQKIHDFKATRKSAANLEHVRRLGSGGKGPTRAPKIGSVGRVIKEKFPKLPGDFGFSRFQIAKKCLLFIAGQVHEVTE
jgi:hypothetical protein